METINELSKKIYANAISKGFYEDGKANNVGERLALIHSEVSEALEAHRKGKHADLKTYFEREEQILNSYNILSAKLDDEDFKTLFKSRIKDTFEDEIADVMIRCMDTAAHMGIDLEKHIEVKMRYNSLREKLHGKKY